MHSGILSDVLINKLEKVQRNILRFCAYKGNVLNHNTDEIANIVELKSFLTTKR